eukprot:scaffold4782_cov32-Tisochrysis_lutea.AAC.3
MPHAAHVADMYELLRLSVRVRAGRPLSRPIEYRCDGSVVGSSSSSVLPFWGYAYASLLRCGGSPGEGGGSGFWGPKGIEYVLDGCVPGSSEIVFDRPSSSSSSRLSPRVGSPLPSPTVKCPSA